MSDDLKKPKYDGQGSLAVFFRTPLPPWLGSTGSMIVAPVLGNVCFNVIAPHNKEYSCQIRFDNW